MDEVSANFRLIGPSNGTKIDGTHLTTTVFVFHGRVKFLWIFLEQNVCNLSPAGSPFLLYSCIVKFQAVQGPRRKKKKRKKKGEFWLSRIFVKNRGINDGCASFYFLKMVA